MRFPRFLTGCASLVVVVAAWPLQVQAACTAARFFSSFDASAASYVYTPGVCPGGRPCQAEGDTSVTTDFTGVFWRLGFGDPIPGVVAGIDNGTFPALDGPHGGWVQYEASYPAYLYSHWAADSRIHGCIDGPAPPRCMAIALGDQFGGVGHFALMTVAADAALNYDFLQPDGAPIGLAPIPRPTVVATTSTPDGIVLSVLPDTLPADALYLDAAACDPEVVVGYRIHQKFLAPGEPPETDRRIELWSLAEGGTGPGGAPLPLDTAAEIALEDRCETVVLALSLAFESGFGTPFVSADSVRIDFDPFCNDNDCDGWCGFAEAPEVPLDCDDENPAVYPGAPQICDGLNNDCNAPGWPDLTGTNEDGEDTDGDGWTGSCDNCPLSFNPLQEDTEADGRGDACDNCLLERNPSQSDVDRDGEGDACDLDDALIYLIGAEPDLFEWQQESGLGPWNVYRGDLDVLVRMGFYTQEPGSNPLAARDCGLALPALIDVDDPASGKVAYYLATGESPAGETGLGHRSDGALRTNANPCP